jgi:hypothetical protein
MNRSIIDVAASTQEWCLPSHGITAGCPSPALDRDAISLHTNIAIAVTTVAAVIDLVNILIRKFYFKDKFNVFLTTLTLHIIGVTRTCHVLELHFVLGLVVPNFILGLVLTGCLADFGNSNEAFLDANFISRTKSVKFAP